MAAQPAFQPLAIASLLLERRGPSSSSVEVGRKRADQPGSSRGAGVVTSCRSGSKAHRRGSYETMMLCAQRKWKEVPSKAWQVA